MTTHLAASTGTSLGIGATMAGLALVSWLVLILGVRGSDRLKINTRDKAGWTGLITGTLSVAAGHTWADIANGIGAIPASLIRGGAFGDPGLGGLALALTVLTFCPRWKKLVVPAVLGVAAAVAYGEAGGLWGIFVDGIRTLAGLLQDLG
ncbi:hypothetical protein [Streptomyces chilikensis]|uniref:Integral membrane protein n=1 Tax=Streptomyces chilikensis TaxID=1194079 RepID=A0ABV3EJD6_9ACTN